MKDTLRGPDQDLLFRELVHEGIRSAIFEFVSYADYDLCLSPRFLFVGK